MSTPPRSLPRPISPALGAVLLDTLGLAAAIEWQAARLRRSTGVRCELTVNDAAGVELPEVCAATLLDLSRETLASAAAHPGASRVAVALTITRHEVTMVVRDDGRGPGTTLRLGLPGAL